VQVALGLIKSNGLAAYAIIVGVVGADQMTKHWALNALADGRTIDLFWTLRFNLVFNSGMAFSQGQGAGRLIGILAIAVAVWFWLSLKKVVSPLGRIGTLILIGGAIGNVVDRLFRGEKWMSGSVVDFIDLQWFPVFNVADSAVTIGAVLLIAASVKSSRSRNARP